MKEERGYVHLVAPPADLLDSPCYRALEVHHTCESAYRASSSSQATFVADLVCVHCRVLLLFLLLLLLFADG